MTGWATSWGVGAALLQACLGCSLVSMRPPAEAGTPEARGNRERCRDIWYPIADTVSAAIGVGWIVKAADDEAKNGPATTTSEYYNGQYSEVMRTSTHDETYKYERAFGYSALLAFTASAIYGYVIAADCAALRKGRAAGVSRPKNDQEPRRGFPGSVLDFSFAFQPAQTAQVCANKGGTWALEGNTASCKPSVESANNPDARFAFELGALSSIVITYHPTQEALNDGYGKLYTSLFSFYGPPQVKPRGISATCVASFSQCMSAGERPSGPVWHWAGGTIALSPTWKVNHAVLELIYSREAPQTQ